jgi:hypothetical protein
MVCGGGDGGEEQPSMTTTEAGVGEDEEEEEDDDGAPKLARGAGLDDSNCDPVGRTLDFGVDDSDDDLL